MKILTSPQTQSMHGKLSVHEEVAAVAWFEGLQLLPQHFQVWDRRIERLLQRYGAGCFPYHWGIDEFSYDPSALVGGKLRVLTASGQFPDGLVFGYDAGTHRPLEYNFGDGKAEMPLRLALGVPVNDFDTNAGAVKRHYQYFGTPVADATNADQKVSIARLLPNLTIQPWHEGLGNYSQLAVIEVMSTPQGYEATSFHPPAIRVMRESSLEKELFSVAVGLRRAAEFVKGRAVPQYLPNDYVNGHGWILSCLLAGLPSLEGLMASQVAHPYELYRTLCGIAGNTSPIAGLIPPYFPPYDHMDPAASIKALVSFILDVIPALKPVPKAWQETPFENQDGAWRLTFPEHYKRKTAVVIFKFKESDSGGHMSSLLEGSLICYASQVAHFRERRVRGLSRRIVEAVPEFGLTSDARQKFLLIEGLGATGDSQNSLIIEIIRGTGKTLIDSVSLATPNE